MSIEQDLDRFQKMKQKRIAFVVYELVKRGGEADIKELEGSLATNYGLRRKTLEEEYFKDLQFYRVLDVTGDKLVLLWEENKAKEWLKRQGILPKE